MNCESFKSVDPFFLHRNLRLGCKCVKSKKKFLFFHCYKLNDSKSEQLPAVDKNHSLECTQQIPIFHSQRESAFTGSQTSNLSFQMTGQDSEKEAAENEKANSNGFYNFSIELGNLNVYNSRAPENPCDEEVQENRGSINASYTDANSYDGEPTGAYSSNRKRKELNDKEKPDKCYDVTNSNAKSLSNTDPGALKRTSAEELQTIPSFPGKRQKKDIEGFGIPYPASGGINKNLSGPSKVYHPQERKTSVESVAGSSVAAARCNELDNICLPRYLVSASIGGFVANVTMKEMDFNISCDGELLSTPLAERDSATALMIPMLRDMPGQL